MRRGKRSRAGHEEQDCVGLRIACSAALHPVAVAPFAFPSVFEPRPTPKLIPAALLPKGYHLPGLAPHAMELRVGVIDPPIKLVAPIRQAHPRCHRRARWGCWGKRRRLGGLLQVESEGGSAAQLDVYLLLCYIEGGASEVKERRPVHWKERVLWQAEAEGRVGRSVVICVRARGAGQGDVLARE